jgi:hypothetical protein
MKEGDIYRWNYREPGDDRNYGRYHCCSRIAIADARGRLRDTYWSSGSDGRVFVEADLPKLDLTYLGNLSDLEKAPEWQADYYDDADIVNLNHSNSSRDNFYLRKGAQRSRAKMLERARYKLEQSESAERSAAWASERLRSAIAKIEAGEIADVHM